MEGETSPASTREVLRLLRSRQLMTAQALEQFANYAVDFSLSERKENIVFEYLNRNPGCEEILNFVNDDSDRDSAEVCQAFRALEQIFMHLGEDGKDKNAGDKLAQSLLGRSLRSFYRCLGERNPFLQKTVLRLLTSMVMLSAASALEVLKTFSFLHVNVAKLLKQTDKDDTEDVRTTYVCFLISFLMSDNVVVRQFLQLKGILNKVFVDLKFDKLTTIQIFLSTLLSRVIQNPAISKTLKVQILNDFTLARVLRLFDWTGPVETRKKRKRDEPEVKLHQPSAEESAEVGQVAHRFLVAACCSHRHGIIFQDRSCGTSGNNFNHLITNILAQAGKPFDSPYTEDLVLKILTASPDQIKFYLPHLQESFSPRASSAWVTAMDFLAKIFENQNLTSILGKCEKQPTSRLLSVVRVGSFPFVLDKDALSLALTNDSRLVRHTMLSFLHRIFKHVDEFLESLVLESGTTVRLNAGERHYFSKCYRRHLLNLVPSVDVFGQCWSLVQNDGKRHSKEEEEEEEEETNSLGGLVFASPVEMKNLALDLQIVLGRLFDFDDGKKFHFAISDIGELKLSDGGCDRTPPEDLQLKLVQVTLSCNAAYYSHEANTTPVVMFLLDCMSALESSETLETAKALLLQVMEKAGFENELVELAVWLHRFSSLEEAEKRALTEVLQKIVARWLRSRSEKVAMEVETAEEPTTEGATEMKADCREKGLAYIASLLSRYAEFSPLTVLLVHELNEEAGSIDGSFAALASTLLVDVLHLQKDPAPLLKLLRKKGKSLSPALRGYVASFRAEKVGPRRRDKENVDAPDSVSDALRSAFAARTAGKKFLADVDEKLARLAANNLLELWKLAHQCLVYITVLLREQERAPSPKTMKLACKVLLAVVKADVPVRYAGRPRLYSLTPVLGNGALLAHFLAVEGLAPAFESAVSETMESVFRTVLRRHAEEKSERHATLLLPFKEKYLATLRSVVGADAADGRPTPTDSALFETLSAAELAGVLNGAEAKNLGANERLAKRLVRAFLERRASDASATAPSPQLLEKLMLLSPDGRFFPEVDGILSSYPAYGSTLSSAIIDRCFEEMLADDRSPIASIAAKMVSVDVSHQEHFKKRLSGNADGLNASVVRNLKPLIGAFLRVRRRQFADPSGELKAVSTLLRRHFWKAIRKSFRSEVVPEEDVNFQFLLLEVFVLQSEIDVKKFVDLLPRITLDVWNSILSNCSEGFLGILTAKRSELAERNLTASCVRVLVDVSTKLSSNEDGAAATRNLCALLRTIDGQATYDAFFGSGDESYWEKFCALVLKRSLNNAELFPMLELLLHVLKGWLKEERSVGVRSLHEMVFGHTHFFPIILDEMPSFRKQKELLIELLLEVSVAEPELCRPSHVPAYLSCYGATLQKSDQLVLRLIHVYETNGVAVAKFRPYMWGSAAIAYYSVQKNMSFSLDNEPKMADVLLLFDPEQLYFTALNFPLTMPLKFRGGRSDVRPDGEAEKTYDPRFVLTLLSYVLGPENRVNLKLLLESKILTVAFAALGSADAPMRAAAYHVFSLLYPHLESSRFQKHRILVQILDALSRGLSEPNMKLSNIMSTFLAKAIGLLAQMSDPMSLPVLAYLCLKPRLELACVPDFLKLFHSADFHKFREHRQWILEVLEDGIRDRSDAELCEKTHCLKMVLSYSLSRLCNGHEMLKILNIVERIAKANPNASYLTSNHSLMPILRFSLSKWNDQRILEKINAILSTHGASR